MDKEFQETLELHSDYSARFANHLLRILIGEAEDEKNIAVSPARLQAVLVLLANWAAQRIRKGILERVGNDVITLKEVNLLSSKNILSLTPASWAADEDGCIPQIELQTLLWAQQELKVEEGAIEKVSDDYPMTLKNVNFKDANLKSIIDNTIDKATHGLIKQLDLPLTKETIAIITDILYFKATWQEIFEPADTKEQLFYGTKGKMKVPMMKRTGYMQYYETGNCQMVKLPYQSYDQSGKRFSMRVFLPKPKHSLGDVLHERWDDEYFHEWEEEEVRLTLPRFSAESSINMKETLSELGLDCIYESTDIIPDCIKDLQIQQIVQQCKVIVDESGTEAAAVTSVGMMLGCCPMERPKPIIMTVNRPFIFEIAEDTTNTILFTGVIKNIEQE